MDKVNMTLDELVSLRRRNLMKKIEMEGGKDENAGAKLTKSKTTAKTTKESDLREYINDKRFIKRHYNLIERPLVGKTPKIVKRNSLPANVNTSYVAPPQMNMPMMYHNNYPGMYQNNGYYPMHELKESMDRLAQAVLSLQQAKNSYVAPYVNGHQPTVYVERPVYTSRYEKTRVRGVDKSDSGSSHGMHLSREYYVKAENVDQNSFEVLEELFSNVGPASGVKFDDAGNIIFVYSDLKLARAIVEKYDGLNISGRAIQLKLY